ncbi:hypothetical protein ACFX2I_006437 [Malus domestica]
MMLVTVVAAAVVVSVRLVSGRCREPRKDWPGGLGPCGRGLAWRFGGDGAGSNVSRGSGGTERETKHTIFPLFGDRAKVKGLDGLPVLLLRIRLKNPEALVDGIEPDEGWLSCFSFL